MYKRPVDVCPQTIMENQEGGGIMRNNLPGTGPAQARHMPRCSSVKSAGTMKVCSTYEVRNGVHAMDSYPKS